MAELFNGAGAGVLCACASMRTAPKPTFPAAGCGAVGMCCAKQPEHLAQGNRCVRQQSNALNTLLLGRVVVMCVMATRLLISKRMRGNNRLCMYMQQLCGSMSTVHGGFPAADIRRATRLLCFAQSHADLAMILMKQSRLFMP